MFPRMSPLALALLAVFSQFGDVSPSQAGEVAQLGEVYVTADKLVTPTKQADESVYTGTAVTAKGIEIQGTKAKMRAHEAIDMLPGVNSESPDGSGLAVEQSSVRLRGVRSSMGALTVEGVPNYGGNPIGPRDYLYDMENMSAISVYKGATPGDIGTGVGSRGGAIVLHPKWSGDKFAAEARPSAVRISPVLSCAWRLAKSGPLARASPGRCPTARPISGVARANWGRVATPT